MVFMLSKVLKKQHIFVLHAIRLHNVTRRGLLRHNHYMKDSDESIIARVREGDQNAYALLVDRYKDRVFSLVMGIIRHRETAEEVALDALVKAYRSLKKFRGESAFSSWLYRIAYNAAISESRKKKGKLQTFDEQVLHTAQHLTEDREDMDRLEDRKTLLRRALEELMPEEKMILVLYYFEDRSVDEISEVTGLSRSNTKVRLFRIRNKLKAIMEQSAVMAFVVV